MDAETLIDALATTIAALDLPDGVIVDLDDSSAYTSDRIIVSILTLDSEPSEPGVLDDIMEDIVVGCGVECDDSGPESAHINGSGPVMSGVYMRWDLDND